MDRVKAQATQLAQQAQEAAQEGKARLDQAQAGRRGDMLLRQLGALVYAERTGRGTSESQARIEQLINEISEHERQNGLNLADPPQPGFGQSLFGQSVFGQASSGQPPAGQGAGEQSGTGQSGEGQADAGQADPAQTPPPAGAAGEMPGVDTTTSFFPAPDDDGAGGPPQG